MEAIAYQAETALIDVVATTLVPSGTFPLAPAGTATLPIRTVAGLASISGYVISDASGTLFVEQSRDGINWDISDVFPVIAGFPTDVDSTTRGLIARARYVNGAVIQTSFRSRIVARPIGVTGAGGGGGGGGGAVDDGLVIANTSALLGGAGVFTTPIFNLRTSVVGQTFNSRGLIRCMAQSDVVGTVNIWQGLPADLVAPWTNATGVAFGVPAGGVGTQFTNIVVAPAVALEYVNGGGAQARMRFLASIE